MAIGLKDIERARKKEKFQEPVKEKISDEDKSVRPWEESENLGLKVRTESAREAVRRARVIVNKNNELVSSIRAKNSKIESENDFLISENIENKKNNLNFEEIGEYFDEDNYSLSIWPLLKNWWKGRWS